MLENGSLKQLISAGLRGAISNPSLLGKVISQTHHYDDAQSILEAPHQLWKEVDRPMLGIPGVREGLPAIERLFAEGASINIIWLCSVAYYRTAVDAYIRGVAMSPAPQGVASVASFLISPVDVKVEWQLERIGAPKAFQLKGKMAIATMAYHYFQLCIKFEFSVQQ